MQLSVVLTDGQQVDLSNVVQLICNTRETVKCITSYVGDDKKTYFQSHVFTNPMYSCVSRTQEEFDEIHIDN